MAMQVKRVLGRRARLIVTLAIVVTGLYLFAFAPVRTYIDQRQQVAQAEMQYQILADTNERLRDRANQLGSDEEIERLAREQYELVSPGQQAYAVMPPPGTGDGESEEPKKDGFWDKVRGVLPF